ncbi:hypothetical protein AK812_SmicGene14627 [Symbiodinium microadriaticum]|uniref:Cold-shock domain-containing protein n=1 Tax=Symbiodinium microadriaticum TaxID=2951 RepID=A0A1Q9E545_SYMMI|nr:hypothetical protein AK812_SmicGene14627 [Symbiodinium microadriaticum]
MEVLVSAHPGISDDCIVSVRCGSTRRQAPLDIARCQALKFPSNLETLNEPLKIDVLKPVASARLVLHPQQDEYFMNFLDKPDMAIGLNVQPASQTSEGVADAGTAGHHPGRKQGQSQGPASARDYLELHGVLKYVQSMLTALIQTKPKDPYDFMLHQLSSSTSCASARQPETGPEDQALRADAESPEAVPASPPKGPTNLPAQPNADGNREVIQSPQGQLGDSGSCIIAGWGFVECNGQDSFLHNKELKGQCPSAGDQVSFKVEPSEKGTVATEVTVQVSSEEAPPVPPPQCKAPPPPLPEPELRGLPLAVANLRCVLQSARAGGWVAWRDLAAEMTVEDRLALAEFSSALMVVEPARMPNAAALAETMRRRLPATAATASQVPQGSTSTSTPTPRTPSRTRTPASSSTTLGAPPSAWMAGVQWQSPTAQQPHDDGVSGSVFLDAPPPDRSQPTGAAFLQTAVSTPASTTPGDGTPWGLTPEMVRQGIARMEAESAAISAAQTPGVTIQIAFYAGEIKRFNPVKGYGFISCEAFPEQDVFVLKSELPQGFGPEGGRCKFKVAKEEKGPVAKQVQLLGAAEQMRSWPQQDFPVSPQPPPGNPFHLPGSRADSDHQTHQTPAAVPPSAEPAELTEPAPVPVAAWQDAAPGAQAETHSTQREALAEDTTALTAHSEEEASRIRLQTVLLKAGKNGVLEEILQNLFRSRACSCELSSQQLGQPGDGQKIGPTPLVVDEQTESGGLGEGDASQLRAHVRERLTNAWTTGELKQAVQEALEHNGPKIAEATAEQSIQFLQDEIKIMAEESKVLHEQVDRLSSEMQRLLLTNQQLLNQIQSGESASKR